MNNTKHLKPSLIEAILVLLTVVAIIAYVIGYLKVTPHIPILICIFALIIYGMIRGVAFEKLQASMIQSAASGIGAIYIFLLIGILISSWIIGGTIPSILYYGFSFFTADYFYAIVFILTAIVGTAIGSSLTTVATIGVAFIGMAAAVDMSLAITAGAIVSGAFFGDKMSPLSDTTNLAASVVGIDLFSHIKNMLWTTVPAFIISVFIYGALSRTNHALDTQSIQVYKEALLATNLVHFYALIPILILIICTVFKLPALLTLAFSSLSAIGLSVFHIDLSMTEILNILYSGFVSETGIENVDALLTRGGLSNMYFTIMLIVLSLTMGGLLFALGMVQRILMALDRGLRSIGQVITGAALTAIGINVLIGEQYLSILLTGTAFKDKFKSVNLQPKNLARVMEDAGTVINPLVPWSVCGLFIASMLNVEVTSYLPFAFFCLLSPILTILFGWLQITITKIEA